MSDLSQLMQYAPTVGAGFMGINQRNAEYESEAKLAELAQLIQSRQGQEQRATELHPLAVRAKQLENQKNQYDLPRIMAEAEKSGLEVGRMRDTQQSTIDSTNFENQAKMRGKIMTELGSIAMEMKGLSDVEKPRYLLEQMKTRGMPDPEGFLQKFKHIPANQLADHIGALSDKYLRSNESYAREIDQERMRNATSIRTAQIAADASKANAATRANATGNNSDLGARIRAELAKTRTLEGQMTILIRGIVEAKQAGDMDLAGQLHAQATALKQAYDQKVNAARAGSVDLNAQSGGRIQTNPGADTQIPNPFEAAPPPAPNTPPAAAAADPGNIKAMVEKQGGQYQPDKFMYRIGPNGKVQSKPR